MANLNSTIVNGYLSVNGKLAINNTNVVNNLNAQMATKLTTARTLWKQSFDGTADITGNIYSTGHIAPATTGVSDIGSSSLKYNDVYAAGTVYANNTCIASKTYTEVYATGTTQALSNFYWGEIKPTSYYDMMFVHYRLYIYVPGQTVYCGYYDCKIGYSQATIFAYANFVNRHTSAVPCSSVAYDWQTATGVTNGYGALFGIVLRSSSNPTSSTYARTVKVEILEAQNCTIQMFDTMKLIGDISYANSTNYVRIDELGITSNGLQETGDNDTLYVQRYLANAKAETAITGGDIIVGHLDTTSNMVLYNKLAAGVTFDINYPILYAGSSFSAGSTNTNVYTAYTSMNSGLTLAAGATVYIKGTLTQSTFVAAATPLTTDTSDTSYQYLVLGAQYSGNTMRFDSTIMAVVNNTSIVYTTGDQTIAGTKTFSNTITGSISGNAETVTNGVYTIGNQTIAGTKTFSSTISGSISGNAGTVTNGVYTTGDQTIGGTKTFSSTITGSV